MNESIEQLTLRVAREMLPSALWETEDAKKSSGEIGEFITRCLAELARQQEPVAIIKRNEAGQIHMTNTDGGAFDVSRFVGSSIYLHPAILQPAAVPDGWKLVPVEPTEDMIDAMKSSAWMPGNYRAMLSAAPLPPADDRIAEMERDVAQRKANREVRRSRILKEMLDMPIERVQAYEKWGRDQARIKELERQRDELLAALENMLDIHGVTQQYADKHIEIPQSWVESSDIARAAIANVKGTGP